MCIYVTFGIRIVISPMTSQNQSSQSSSTAKPALEKAEDASVKTVDTTKESDEDHNVRQRKKKTLKST
jgi:hypothetical protein